MKRWLSTRRLVQHAAVALEPIGYIPPAEYEAQYYAQDSGGGARRHPHPDREVDGAAAEHPQDVLRPSENEVLQTELNA